MIPSSFLNCNEYKILRRYRTGNGGSIMVLIKDWLKLISNKKLDSIEAIYFIISFYQNFIFYSNPDFGLDTDFLIQLEAFLISQRTNTQCLF